MTMYEISTEGDKQRKQCFNKNKKYNRSCQKDAGHEGEHSYLLVW